MEPAGKKSGSNDAVSTYFAPPERLSDADVKEIAELATQNPVIQVVLESVGGFVLVLNTHRQVLAASREVLVALDLRELNTFAGLRPGELLNCEYAEQGPGGCGTSQHCSACGAVLAIMTCQWTGQPASDECHMTMMRKGALESLEFQVKATPITISGHDLIIFVLHDISSLKRREVLERIFIHDLRNTLTSLMGLSELLSEDGRRSVKNPVDIARRIVKISKKLSSEVSDQELLYRAEHGQLRMNTTWAQAQNLMDFLAMTFDTHDAAAGKNLIIEKPDDQTPFETDVTLLSRVLTNMAVNALEATPDGGTVDVHFERKRGSPTFSVHNIGVMSEEVALQVFKRSFSTKAPKGRGLGTYGMKLFGEQYLGGSVSFVSTEQGGTTFTIALPKV